MKRGILVFIAFIAFSVNVYPQDSVTNSVRDYRRANEHRLLREFVDLLSIPNVAADTANINRNAEFIANEMNKRGLKPQLLRAKDTSAPPVVYGEFVTPGAKQTVIFYAHYDGQPTDPAAWKDTEPWKPALRTAPFEKGGKFVDFPKDGDAIDPEWRLYARSASDDKGGVFAIITALDALRAKKIAPTVNIKFVFEGEEEAGSAHLGEILAANRELLKADAFIVCDGPTHQSGRKQLVFGVRGIISAALTLYGANRSLHSGHYGNWSPNPALTMVRLLASMKDANDRVTIPGWYDDVEPLGPAEIAAIKSAPQFDEELKKQLGLVRTEGKNSLLESIALPSLNINGIKSGDVGALARNVIPSTAEAALDLRLVKGNDSRRQVEKLRKYVEGKGFYVIDREPTEAERLKYPFIAKLVPGTGYNAQRTRLDLPISKMVIAAVSRQSKDAPVIMPTLGGSLPLSIISETLSVPTITVPIANYDNNQHAENENIRLQNLWDGIEIFGVLMTMGQ